MAKQLTNEVPLQILTVAEYLHNKSVKVNSMFTKGKHFVNGFFYTPKELEEAYPTTHVKVVAKIHNKPFNLSTKKRP